MSSPTVVQVARAAGFDALFVDLEHSTLSLDEASRLCTAGLLAGITPFVRVPHQCGNGFVQRVLDGGAMGVIFPHISSRGMPVLTLLPLPRTEYSMLIMGLFWLCCLFSFQLVEYLPACRWCRASRYASALMNTKRTQNILTPCVPYS